MILLFEEYQYPKNAVAKFCESLSNLYLSTLDGKIRFECVGYCYSKYCRDVIFIMPKVMISHDEDGKKLAFGKWVPEDIIWCDEYAEDLEKERGFISQLSIWLYQAISQYSIRQTENKSVITADITDVIKSSSTNELHTRTYLDIMLQLFRFHKEHSQLFTFLSLSHSGGVNNICWSRTVSKKTPLVFDGFPVYLSLETKKKEINLEDSIISLFYSVLMFLKEKFHFNVVTHINYPLLENSKITAMINTGKGTKFLRSIRKNYFKDELVFLWKVLYIFFDKSEKIASGRYHQEKLLIRNFNNVFEDMIDRLLSNSEKKVPPRLKEQLDGKIVDHIYSDESLTGPEKIYFIGDSKYYQERHSVGLPSIYKQFTYAKNIIQFNVGILDGTALLDKSIRYRDSLTEGYNITPNFFIRGTVNFERMNGKEDNLENINETHLISQFGDRLFDRDTLLLQTYSINFLYVMESYIARGNNESFRKKAKAAFREDILKRLNEKYTFYQVECKSDEQVCSFVNKYFRKLIGKMFRVSESSTDILLAFEKGQQEENDIIQDLKEKEWSVNEIVIPISTPEKE